MSRTIKRTLYNSSDVVLYGKSVFRFQHTTGTNFLATLQTRYKEGSYPRRERKKKVYSNTNQVSDD